MTGEGEYKDTVICLSNTTDNTTDWGQLTSTDAYIIDPKYWEYCDPNRVGIITNITEPENYKKGDDNMRYLYEVILVNPKNDNFYVGQYVARSETSALMKAYRSTFKDDVEFDDLKISCRVLMEWKKEKSLKKAIETIKEIVD